MGKKSRINATWALRIRLVRKYLKENFTNRTTTRSVLLIGAVMVLILSSYNLSIVGSQVTDENLYTNQDKGVVNVNISLGGVSEEAGLQGEDRLVMIIGYIDN